MQSKNTYARASTRTCAQARTRAPKSPHNHDRTRARMFTLAARIHSPFLSPAPHLSPVSRTVPAGGDLAWLPRWEIGFIGGEVGCVGAMPSRLPVALDACDPTSKHTCKHARRQTSSFTFSEHAFCAHELAVCAGACACAPTRSRTTRPDDGIAVEDAEADGASSSMKISLYSSFMCCAAWEPRYKHTCT